MVTYSTCMTCKVHQRIAEGAFLYTESLQGFLERHPPDKGHDLRLLPSEVARAISGPQTANSGQGKGTLGQPHLKRPGVNVMKFPTT
jgi:hypothetical protein